MKLPISWLKEYVDIGEITPEELADKLLNIGFEVEEIIRLGEGIEGVVVGKILDVKKHIDADKLSVCMVDVGTEITTIVTGASNISVGDLVPVATDGATVHGGKRIVAAPLRGVMSYGMMCSGEELDVDNSVIDGAEVNGILILPPATEIGKDIRDVLRLRECVLDISVTANRPDCQSVYGIAREIAALLNKKIKPLNLKYKVGCKTDAKVTVKVQDYERCPRYTATVISNVKPEKSPEFLRDRLRYCGIRPINNLVDITNYVLLEVGQPLHAFDLSAVKDTHIEVRLAKKDERIVALDGNEYELNQNTLLICDAEKPLAIAGIMGGEFSGINDDTGAVLLEAAVFTRGGIRASSRALGLRSDSSARYEKGVDYGSADVGRERALALFTQLKAGTITDAMCRDEVAAPKPKVIKTTVQAICDILGISIKAQTIIKILKNLCFDVVADGDKLTVTAPLYREDIDNFTDLAEEVIRFYGYDNLQSTLLKTASTTLGGQSLRRNNIDLIKTFMCGLGAYEATTYAFITPKLHDKILLPQDDALRNAIRILNPLSDEYSIMRTQLIANMLNTVYLNLNRKNKNFRLFEVGRRYLAKSLPLTELPDERETLCFAFCGDKEDFYQAKDACVRVLKKFFSSDIKANYSSACYLHPGISADLSIDGVCLCSVGKVHPSVAKNYDIADNVYIAQMDIESFIDNEPISPVYTQLPRFPIVERDFAVTVSRDTPVGDMLAQVKAADPLCCDAELFDIYTGEQIEDGLKSVAFRVKLMLQDRTLNDSDISRATDKILEALKERFDAKLR